MRCLSMVIRWLVLAGMGVALAACSSAPVPRPTPTATPNGTVVGTVDGGCFGYNVPNSYTVTVTASQGGVPKGSTVITETKSECRYRVDQIRQYGRIPGA